MDEAGLDAPEGRGVVGHLTDQHGQVAPATAGEAVPQTAVDVEVPRVAGALPTLSQVVDRAPPVDLVVLNLVDLYAQPSEHVYEVSGGGLRVVQTTEQQQRKVRELNPGDTEFIIAEPPCDRGERRFIAGFGVDANKRLTLSLKDLKEGNRSHIRLSNGEKFQLPVKDFPVVKL